jgi:hypothetical protein
MRARFSTIVLTGLILVGCSSASRGPLLFQSPTGWKVKHKPSGDLPFYTVIASTPDEGSLMFYQWPSPSRPEEIPTLVQQLADGFLKKANGHSEFTLASKEYRIEQLAGEHCQGSYVTFLATTSSGRRTLTAIFMINLTGKIWYGQFIGTPEAWKQAITVVQSIKKNG